MDTFRDCGLALIDFTRELEEQRTIDKDSHIYEVTLLALAARSRRILRAAYRLMDAEDFPEAVPQLRIMQDYLITVKWLSGEPNGRLGRWALTDLQHRKRTIEKVLADRKLDAATKTEIARQGKETKDAIENTRNRIKAEGRSLEPAPHLEDMAAEVELRFPYAFAYRLQSQADVHASPLAVDHTLFATQTGFVIRRVPDFALSAWDQYQLGALLLLDLLRGGPPLSWTRGG